jgi:hypothetical protein
MAPKRIRNHEDCDCPRCEEAFRAHVAQVVARRMRRLDILDRATGVRVRCHLTYENDQGTKRSRTDEDL